MNSRTRGLCAAQVVLVLTPALLAHGGSYPGPGDTVPPAGGGGGVGGGTGGGPPTPSGGSTGNPGSPSRPGSGQPGVGTGGVRPRGGVSTGAAELPVDLTTWEFWWVFNRHGYLNLKRHVHDGGPATGLGDELFASPTGAARARDTLKPSEELVRARVVPALLAALERERSNDIVTGALIALAKLGDARGEDGASAIEPRIARFLADPNQEIAETAAVALGILGNESSVGPLCELALDTKAGRELAGRSEVPPRTRAFAAYGLGLVGASVPDAQVRQRIVEVLTRLLAAPEGATRDLHVAALSALGLTPLERDPEGAHSPGSDPSRSLEAELAWIAGRIDERERNPLVRAHAPTALARLAAGAGPAERERAARALLAALAPEAKQHAAVRQSALLALGALGDSDADALDVEIRRTIAAAVDDPDQQAQRFACIAMAQVGGRPGAGSDPESGRAEARAFLLAQLRRTGMRPWAGLGIGVMEHALTRNEVPPGSASATMKAELRRELASSTSPEPVGAFAIGLGLAGDPEARSVLLATFGRISEDRARGYVAVALGLLDAREAVAPIQAVARESRYKPDLLQSAATALGLLGDKQLVPELIGMLAEARGLSSQAAIASALGLIGDSRSIDPLVAMLERKEGLTDGARGFAAVALGIVADKEPLPWNAKLSRDINYRANTTTLTGEQGTGILDLL